MRTKGLMIIGGGVVIGVLGYFLYGTTNYSSYSVLCFTVAVIAIAVGAYFSLQSNDPTKQYQSKVRNILNTYDSILVKSNTAPSLDDRNVVQVLSMDDLVDAQLELRKPICYIKQTESCSFVLLDEKEAYIYIEKLNDKVISPVEIEIKNAEIKAKGKEDMDSEMLKNIEKTTIVKLSNKKSYKVSPVRKKNKEEKEDEVEEIKEDKKEEKKDKVPEETIEILTF